MSLSLRSLLPSSFPPLLLGLMALSPQAATLPVGGARAWYETENGEGTAYLSSDGFVDTWMDQSGNGFNLSNFGANRPALVDSVSELEDLAALDFDGEDDRLFGEHEIFTTGVATIFIVAQIPAIPDGIAAFFDTGPDGGSRRWYTIAFNNPLQLRFGRDDDTTITTSNIPPAGEYAIITLVADGANSSLSVDGESQATGTVSNDVNSNAAPFVVGSRFTMAPNHQHFDGHYAELVIYDSVLSETDRDAVENYLQEKYGRLNTGPRAWYETEGGEGIAYNSSGGFINSWLDQSGNDFHLSNSGTRRPALEESVPELGDKPALNFDGTNDRLFGHHEILTTGEATIFVVSHVPDIPTGSAAWFDTGSSGTSRRWSLTRPDNSKTVSFGRDGGAPLHNPNLPATGGYAIISALADGENSGTWINGLSQVTGTISTEVNDSGTPFVVGSRFNQATQWFDGNMAELIVYDRAVSERERVTIERNLRAKYGITAQGPRAWYETTGGEGVAFNSSGGFVDTWLDQSGNGFHLSNTADHRPALVSAVPELLDQPALDFDGVDDRLFGNHQIFTTGVATIFIVAQVPAIPDSIAAYFDTGPNVGSERWYAIAFDDPLQFRFGRDDDTVISTTMVPATGEYTVLTLVADGANSSVAVDGENQTSGEINNVVNSNVSPFVVGSRHTMQPGHQHFDGNYAELIIYDRVLSAPERLAIERDLQGKYFTGGADPLRLDVDRADQENLTFQWDSKPGRVYNLRSELGPSDGDPGTWPIFGAHQEISATPPTNTLTIPLPADAERFFVIEELTAPPAYQEDFSNGMGGWTTNAGPGDSGNTSWDFGPAAGGGPSGGPDGSVNFWMTNAGTNYGGGSNILLSSPAIDLNRPGATRATLSFSFWDDLDGLARDFCTVRIRNSETNEQIGADMPFGDFQGTWRTHLEDISAALGNSIIIEAEFRSDEDGQNFLGIGLGNFEINVE